MKKKKSLRHRLFQLIAVCLIPITVLIIYLLVMTNNFSSQYDDIVEKITEANAYNIDFKEEMDYSMYIIVANSQRAGELIDTDRPREMIAEAREVFQGLSDENESEEIENLLAMILQSLNTLDERVVDLKDSAMNGGSYEANMESLDLDIRVLTELIQEQIQTYIYQQSQNLESLREGVRKEVDQAITITSFILAVILLGAFLISRWIVGSITEPIGRLRAATKKAGAGDFEIRAKDEELEEISVLSSSFNAMVEKIGQLVDDIHIEELNLREAELRLLQEQINPHFLYNTLDNIIWLAEAGEKEQVVHMVSALSSFFRTTLSNGKNYVTVAEEKEHIESYLEIQQFRYRDILSYDIKIPEEICSYRILKLMLQPLVENALYHGIKNKRGMGHILVEGTEQEDTLVFEVTDTGIGMTPERVEEVRKAINGECELTGSDGGFGLRNVNERIRLNYGDGYGLTVESEYQQYTKISVTLPKESEL